MPSLPQMIIETLRAYPTKTFKARELAQAFLERYPEKMAKKRETTSTKSDEALMVQLAAEIGGSRIRQAKKQCPNVATQDTPKPRRYYWKAQPESAQLTIPQSAPSTPDNEQALYPQLIHWLHKKMGLFSVRINEKKSSNSAGRGGNHWLHPDIVAMEALDHGWHEAVRNCVRSGHHRTIRLWSFEVKQQLTRGTVRQAFFQSVSNSSWANFGYLVTTGCDDDVERELHMLCGLHGIGVLILDPASLFDSHILIPAREKPQIDWQSVNRLVEINSDFSHYAEQVDFYIQTGRLTTSAWNK